LAASTSKINDGIWGFSYNSDYDEVAISSKLIETAQHKKKAIFRIDDDAITTGSSGTPLWNMRTNTLLGVVHWWKEKKQNAFVLPANNFEKHFPEIYQKNIQYHQAHPKWKEAIEKDRKQPAKKENDIPKYLGSKPTFPELFIGRDTEVEAIHQSLTTKQNILLLVNGAGGIGKTTLASKYYYQYQDYYQHLVWVFSGISIIDALLTLAMSLEVEFPPKMPNEERFSVLLQAMAELNEPCLLIIDNANEVADIEKYYGTLLQCTNFHILLTTRVNKQLHNTKLYEVKPLEPKDAIQLFIRHYEAHDTNENDLFFSIYEAVNRNTLVVELLAKNLANFNNELEQDYSLARLLENINDSLLKLDKSEAVGTFYHAKNGIQRKETPENIIAAMYDLSQLNEIEKRLLSIFSVLPAESIPFDILKDLVSQERLGKHLLSLFEKGWLDYDKNGKSFRVSPVVQDIIIEKNVLLYENCKELIDEIIKKLHHENFYINNHKPSLIFIRYGVSIINNIVIKDFSLNLLSERIGFFYKETGDLTNAQIFYKISQNTLVKLLEEQPNDNDLNLKKGIAIIHGKLGEVYLDLGELEIALNNFQQFAVLMKKLHEDDRNNMKLQNLLAISYEKIGSVNQSLGNFKKALKYFEKYNSLTKKLFENNSKFKIGLAISYEKLGSIYSTLGDFRKALDFFKKYNKLAKEEYKANPNNEYLTNVLGISCQFLGRTYASLKNNEIALVFFRQYNQLEKELYENNPNNVNFKLGLAISYKDLGSTHQILGDLELALDFFEKDIFLTEELYNDYPDNINFKNGLAISNTNLAEYYRLKNNKELAFMYFKNAKKLWEELIIQSPKHIEFKDFLKRVNIDLDELQY